MTWMRRIGLLAVLLGLALTGCAPTNRSKPEPSAAKTASCSNRIQAEAVVIFYLPSEKTYFTQQELRFCPSPDFPTLEITSLEPQGIAQWKCEKGTFIRSVSAGLPLLAEWQQESILTVFAGFLYGSTLLPLPAGPEQTPVNLEGQMYTPIPLPLASREIEVVLYKNQKTGLLDRVGVYNSKKNVALMAVLYNWRLLGEGQKTIPRKIDIFDISESISSKKLLIQLEYKAVKL
jgi:hypothetical protein